MRSYFLACIGVAMGVSAASAEEARVYCDGHEDTLNTYLQMHEILFMERDTSRVAEFYAPEFISHNQDEGGGTQEIVNQADMQEMWKRSKQMSPDRVLINNLIFCVDDFVIARVTMKGRRLGPLPNLTDEEKVKGRYFETSAIDIYRFQDGRVVERWGNNDGVTIMRQLGLLPGSGSEAE